MITVKDFLVHLPGPAALEGAVVGNRKWGTRQRVKPYDVDQVAGLTLIETPPLYPTGHERYCAWCKERLCDHYSERTGYVHDAACPSHGYPVPVLHAPGLVLKSPIKITQEQHGEFLTLTDLETRRKVSYQHLKDQWRMVRGDYAGGVSDYVRERVSSGAFANLARAAKVTCRHPIIDESNHCAGCHEHARKVAPELWRERLHDLFLGHAECALAKWQAGIGVGDGHCGDCSVTEEELREHEALNS